jgi:protein-tyrosine phosphatase
MRQKLAERGLSHIEVDSAGTHSYHVGEAPDRRTVAAAKKRGYDLSQLRARKVTREDFHQFDLILAMDGGHLETLQLIQPKGSKATVALFLEYAGATPQEHVPDPYYGGAQDFEHVLDLCEAACEAMAERFLQAGRHAG